MSNYTKSTNFATKDNLTPGDPLKIVRGTEIDTEFNNIATAVATKTDNSAAAITGGSITGITDLAVADGGTGASTATAALNNLLPSQSGNSSKYLQTDGTNATWDAISINTGDITGTLGVTNGGTGVTTSTGTGNVVLSNSPTLVTPALGTPASGVATNITGLPISTGVSGLGTGVATFLGTPSSANLISAVTDETGSGALVFANSPTLVTPALGTPSALVGTNITGTASGLTAGNVTTNANLTGAVTSSGNATSLGSFTSAQLLGALTDETGTGSAVFATSPTLVTPLLGTPTSGVATNLTGLPLTTGVTGTLPTANGGTNLTSFTSGGVVYASSTSALATGSALLFDGTNLGVGVTPTNKLTIGGTDSSVFFKNAGATTGYAATQIVNTGGSFYMGVTSSTGAFWANTSGNYAATIGTSNATNLTFATNDNIRATLDSSGNLGIGTSSPVEKLTVNGAIAVTGAITGHGANRTTLSQEGANGAFWQSYGANASTYGTYKLRQASSDFSLSRTAVEIDTSGNLGVSVTPSAWASSYKALEVKSSGGLAADGAADVLLLQNAYLNSSGQWIRRNAQAVGIYNISGASHVWYQSASSTAGSAATLTQALTLHASGGLSLGNTTDYGAGNLSVTGKAKIITSTAINSSTATTVTTQSSGAVLLRDNTNGGTALVITDTTGGLVIVSQVGATTYVTTSPTATQIQVTNSSGNIQCLGGSSRNAVTIVTTALQLD